MVEIIISISLIIIIGVSVIFIILKKDDNNNLENVKKEVLVSANVLQSTNESLKMQISDLEDGESICVTVNDLYNEGLLDDKSYTILKDENVYVKIDADSEFPGYIVDSNSDCILYDKNYVSKIPIDLVVFTNNVENINNKLEELKEALLEDNYKLDIETKSYEVTENKTYNYSTYTSLQSNSTSMRSYDFLGSVGNYLIFTDSSSEGDAIFYNILTGEQTSSIMMDGVSQTPIFGSQYVSYFAFFTVGGSGKTARTSSKFLTTNYKNFIYQAYERGKTFTCPGSGEYTLANSRTYGYYYLKYYKCGIKNNNNNTLACSLDGKNMIKVGALSGACSNPYYEVRGGYEGVETEGNHYGNATDPITLNELSENNLYDYYFGNGLTSASQAIPTKALNKLNDVNSIYSYFGLSNNGCDWSESKCTIDQRFNIVEMNGKNGYYIDVANKRYGVLIKDTFVENYYRVFWVKEKTNSIYVVNNTNDTYKCIADVSNVDSTSVSITGNCLTIDFSSTSIDDIKALILD